METALGERRGFPRSSAQLRLLAAFGGSSKIAAWCDANDPYCASGVNLIVHLTYLNRYQGTAASFVPSKIWSMACHWSGRL
jgi:cutinase